MTREPTLRVSSGQRFSVFEFNEEDEQIEKASEKFVGKFQNRRRKRDPSPVTKYKFLECFSGYSVALEQNKSSQPIHVDIDVDDGRIDVGAGVVGGNETLCKGTADELVDVDADVDVDVVPNVKGHHCTLQDDGAVKEDISAFMLSSVSNYEVEPVGLIVNDNDNDDADNQIEISSSSTSSASTISENEEDQPPECVPVGHQIDHINKKVVVFPDFILCGDAYCTDSRIIFSASCFIVDGSAINGSKGKFNAEWSTGDICHIESEWCGRVETAMVILYLKSKVSDGAGTTIETSGIEKLKFSVYDPHWLQGQETIKLLDVKYMDAWSVAFPIDWKKDENARVEHSDTIISKPYFPILDEPLKDVIYPKGDPDAVLISKRDVELLQPESFINDTIIDFYIKYLKNKLELKDQHRFHFFNSFFFRKLADLDKDPSSACEGRAAFHRVRKWTRKMNLFEKDYIFIPVNYSLHWSLIVICHPGEVAHSRDDESKESPKVPCILHMDSIRGSHRGLKNLVQSYLYEEWKERHYEMQDDVSSKFLHLQFVQLELPQQENSFDCGLFLLHYVELFLEEAPINFSPFKISYFSNFLTRNWFLAAEASMKRGHIKRLVREIIENQSPKALPVDSTDKHPFSRFPDTNEQETGVEFLEERCSLPKVCQSYSSPNAELGVQISVSGIHPPRVVQQRIKETGLKSRQEFEPGTSARSFSNGNYWQRGTPTWRSLMSPVQEQISDLSSDPEDELQIGGLGMESRAPSHSDKDFRSLGTTWKQAYISLEELDNDSSSSGTSNSGTMRSSEIGVDENCHHPEFEGFDHLEEADKHESSSTSSEDLATYVVEDSLEANCMHDGHVGKDSPFTFHRNGNGSELAPSVDEFDTAESVFRKDNLQMNNEDLVLGAEAAKRSKLASSSG